MTKNSNINEKEENTDEKVVSFDEKIKEAQNDFMGALEIIEEEIRTPGFVDFTPEQEALMAPLRDGAVKRFRELEAVIILVQQRQFEGRKQSIESRNSPEWRGYYRGQQVLAAELLRLLLPIIDEPVLVDEK